MRMPSVPGDPFRQGALSVTLGLGPQLALVARPDPATGDLLVDVPGQKYPVRIDREYLACYDPPSRERVVSDLIRIELGRRQARRLFQDGRHDRGWRK